MSGSNRIRVLTLNCWGLRYLSKHRVARINAIASFLSTSQHDIVCLQEVFVSKDFKTIRASVSDHLPFVKLFHGGSIGGGLVIFSRFPIVAATVQPFSLNGSPFDTEGGDWFAGKGVGSVLVMHPVLGHIQVFNTHFFSQGGDYGPDYKRAHRLVNAWEFAKLIKQSAETGHHVIAVGDFNSIPSTLPMNIVCEHSGLHDAWASVHPPPNLSLDERSRISPADAISLYGYTWGSPLGSYWYSTDEPRDQLGTRIDYVLFRNPSSSSSTASPQLVPTEARVAFSDLIPGQNFSYSDHFGVEATFEIEHPDSKKDILLPDIPIDGKTTVLKQSRLSREHALQLLDALKIGLTHSVARAQSELRVSIACALTLASVLISTAWSPLGYLTPLFVFAGAAVTWVGTTGLYVGYLHGRWDAHTLQNVIEEVELYAENDI